MLILGIETSCDETAAAVLQGDNKNFKAKLKSSVVASQVNLHKKTGGVVPEVAARAHVESIVPIIEDALKKSRSKLKNLDAVAVTAGPGLLTSLRVGVDTAKAIGFALGIPVIPINHMEAHLYSPLLRRSGGEMVFRPETISFPALALTVSGGHTELVLLRGWNNLKKIGATKDDAAGEAFDKIAKLLGLPYPGGPALSKLASAGDPDAIMFPRPMLETDDSNFSFAGLKTAVLYHLQKQRRLTAKNKADVAASAQAAIVDVLTKKTFDAIAVNRRVKHLLVGGGVAANKNLLKSLQKQSKLNNITLHVAAPSLTGDNAGMIALTGYIKMKKDGRTPKTAEADANWEIE